MLSMNNLEAESKIYTNNWFYYYLWVEIGVNMVMIIISIDYLL